MLNFLNFMDILEGVYQKTTNPKTTFIDLLSLDVAFSILFHSIVYTVVIYLFLRKNFLQKKILPFSFFKKFFFLFFIIMSIGYPLRLWKAKAIHTTKNDDVKNRDTAIEMGLSYRTWYFLG